MSAYDVELISGAANTVSKAAAWIHLVSGGDPVDGDVVEALVAFAMSKAVAISTVCRSSQRSGILCSLKGHSGRVNAVVACHSKDQITVISGSDDSTVRVWVLPYTPNHTCFEALALWESRAVLSAFSGPVTTLATLSDTGFGILVAACDSHGRLAVWTGGCPAPFELVEAIDFHPMQMPNDLYFMSLAGSIDRSSSAKCVALIVGGIDSRIHLRVSTYDPISATRFSAFAPVGMLAGHEDWITCLSSIQVAKSSSSNDESSHGTLILASGSQDSKIRIWKFEMTAKSSATESLHSVFFEPAGDDADEGADIDADEEQVQLVPDEVMTEARLCFDTGGSGGETYSVFFDALLLGHEDWVTSVTWMRHGSVASLFSTSMDRNMIIWREDASGVWAPYTRFGDIGGNLGGSIGGNLLGFTCGCVSGDGLAVLGVGYGGSFHLWRKGAESDAERWQPHTYLTGHFGCVSDLAWASDGGYFVTVSSDQTTRLFAPVLSTGASRRCWKELSRPQVHGFDLNAVAISPLPAHTIYSAGDEKIIRAFDATSGVLLGLERLSGLSYGGDEATAANRVDHAFIPELGLSNKPSEQMTAAEKSELQARNVSSLTWVTPPLESQLSDHTIWPESRKLYGHTNDVICIALSSSGRLLASACKSRNSQTAGIIIWDTSSMAAVQTLYAHESTVACLRFSIDDTFLASSGKDRILCAYAFDKASERLFKVAAATRNAHRRIVWDCSWSDDHVLFTSSRDGSFKLWTIDRKCDDIYNSFSCICTHTPFCEVAVTSIDAICTAQGRTLLVLGSELGDIHIAEVTRRGAEFVVALLLRVDDMLAHGSAVKRARWCKGARGSAGAALLATCGADTTTRVFKISF